MFEGRGVESRSAGMADSVELPAAEGECTVMPRAVGPDPVASAADSQALVERLAAVAAGAGLARLVEDLLAVLLVPAGPDAADGAAGAAEVAAILGVPNTDGVLAAIGSPADRDLAQTAGQLGVDWGEGTGIDALASLGGQVLSELVAACHRLAAWASWCESTAAACLARTAEMNRGAAPWGPDGQPEQLITEEERRFTTSGEIAARLGVPRMTASQVLDRGQALLQPEFAPTEALFRSGLLDASKTSIVVRRLQDAGPEVAAAVQERVLPRAPRRTASQLARDIDRTLAALDPCGVSSRRKRNVERRHVTRPREAGEGTHEMRLLLPSLDAFLLDATLDAIAASARAAGDERSPGQLRADAITGITLRTLQSSQYAACRNAAGDCGGTTAASDDGGSTAADCDGEDGMSGVGADDSGASDICGRDLNNRSVPCAAPHVSGVGAGSGSSTWVESRLLPDGVPLEGLLGALSGLVDSSCSWWTPSGTEPVFPPSGITINVDVTVPLDHLLPDGAGVGGSPPSTDTGIGSSPPLTDNPATCGTGTPPTAGGESAPASVASGRSLPAAGGRTPTDGSREVAPIGGGGDLPGAPAADAIAAAPTGTAEVMIGASRVPVPAATARALAAGGAWRRLVTDPLSGTVLDVGRTHYRPPAALRDLVQARDQECVFPGCTTPASRCDIDHVSPWADGGTTSLSNLTSLCEAHHRLKRTPGWTLSRQDDGALLWTTPTGAEYRRGRDGTITLMAHKNGPRQLVSPARRVPEQLANAVTDAVVNRLHHGLDLAAERSGGAAGIGGRICEDPRRIPQVTSRGPRPGLPIGAFETHPYPDALHSLGLAPLIDEIPPF